MFASKLQPSLMLRWGAALRASQPPAFAAAASAATSSPFETLTRRFASDTDKKGVPIMNGIGGFPHGPAAFVFDIDGVLLHGREVLPPALEAVSKLVDPATGAWRFPVVFMTNGGGTTEAKRAEQLSRFLHVPVRPEQVLLAHTPMKGLTHEFADKPVLVSGKGDVAAVARQYGFNKVVHAKQLGVAMPLATPFTKYTTQVDAAVNADPCPVRDSGLGTEAAPFRAVLVMTDPDDWYRDLQLILDVVSGGGVPGRAPEDVPKGTPPVPVYYSAGDLVWANGFPTNRLGQGAFAEMVDHMYRQVHGQPLPNVKFFGKPNPEPYRMAECLLLEQARQMRLIPQDHPLFNASDAEFKAVLDAMEDFVHLPARTGREADGLSAASASVGIPPLPFSGIFAVGDNPASDIRGANSAGSPWVSILVHTGVFKGPGKNCSKFTANIAVANVSHAVEAALHRTRNSKWHSMR